MSNELAIQETKLPAPAQSGMGIQAVARAEIDAQVATAREYPRDVSRAIKQAMGLATMDRETAARMFYAMKDGQPVKGMPKGAELGPSVRLTEVFMSSYGNLQCGSRIVEIGDEHVVVAGFAHDLENNTRVVCEETASILTREGRRYGERMVIRTAQAAMAKARRNAILQVIPRVFIERVMKSAIGVAAGLDKPKTERWRDLVLRFASRNIADKQMLALIERTGIADMNDDDFAYLESCLAQIIDGDTTIDALLQGEVIDNKASDLTS